MNIFLTRDRTNYRRWINILPGFLIAGSAQYLSGRRKTGIIWFCAAIFLGLANIAFLISPASSYDLEHFHWVSIVSWIFQISLLIDACRRPIPRMRAKKWGASLGIPLLVILVLVLIIRQFFIHPFYTPTGSMQPTIMGITTDTQGNKTSGDYVIVNKTAYWKHPPERGDIVVFKTSGIDHPMVRKSTLYMKRIVGLPGETISIRPPNILVNGNPVMEPEIFRTISNSQNEYSGYTLAIRTVPAILTNEENVITLADDEYLEIGDNSQRSLDGRYYGPIKESSILGKVIYRYAPANRKGWIK